jgi:hypothetical protein
MGVFFSAWYMVRCFALGCREMWGALQGSSWPTVEATVESVILDEHRCERLLYTYEVDGKSHQGSLTRPTLFGVERLEHRFLPETVMPVHVSPGDPGRSYVPAGKGWAAAIAAGVPGLVAGGVMVWIALQAWQFYGPGNSTP